MKNKFKKIVSTIVVILLVCGAMPAINLSLNKQTKAVSSTTEGWFYSSQLDATEKKFYDAIASAYVNNVFKTGSSFDLLANGVISSSDVAEYAQGNSKMLSAFNIAKDAYMLDHPELFYMDFEKLSLRLGKQGNNYIAVLDSGKNSNYFNDTLNTLGVGSAIISFNGESGFLKFLPTNATDSKDKVVQVARNIANNVQPSTNSAYSNAYFASLGNATAEGYAKLFKLCMDELNIRSVVVSGYLASESFGTISRHFWNFVELDGRWLGVDVFLNDSLACEDYLIVRQEKMDRHIAGVSVLGGKEFELPELESFKIEKSYTKDNMLVDVLYNGMNASQLLYHKDLYIVQVMSESTETVTAKALFNDTIQNSQITVDNGVSSIVYAVTATAPDDGVDYDSLNKSDLIVIQTFENEVLFKDIIRPIVSTVTATNITNQEAVEYSSKQSLASKDAWHIKLVYDDALKQAGESINIVTKVGGLDVSNMVQVTNLVWSDLTANVVEFDFKPAVFYTSGETQYSFELDGLVSAVTNVDNVLARPVYIAFDTQSINISSLSQSSVVWNNDDVPYLEASTNVSSMTIKNDAGSAIENVESQDFILVSLDVGDEIKSKIKQSGAEEYFFNFILNAKGNVVDLNGSYIKIVIPFKGNKGYDLLKQNLVQVFHYDSNGENATIVDAVVTKCGVVISTNKTGYFKVVYGNQTEDKYLTISSTDKNGKVSCEAILSGVGKIESNQTVTFSPNAGFEIEYVLLNGKDITAQVSSNTLQLKLSDLENNNTLQVSFISSQRKLVFAQNGFDSLDDEFVSNQQLEFVASELGDFEPDKENKTLTLLIIVGVWLVLCGGVALTIILLRKRTNKAEAKEKEKQE